MANNQRLIYVGPNFKNRAILQYQVFVGGIPKHINKELEKCPELKRLFVELTKLEAAKKAIETPGNPLYKYYNSVKEVF